jgi:hypothetical protein
MKVNKLTGGGHSSSTIEFLSSLKLGNVSHVPADINSLLNSS